MHIPVNHHLRPLYRVLATLAGLYLLVFGIMGFIQTRGADFFTQEQTQWVLGLRANPAFAVLAMLAGAVILGAQLIGRNLDHYVNLFAAMVLAVVGMAMLAVLQTDANIFAFSMVNVIVSFILALVVGTAGLYDKLGTSDAEQDEHALRRYGA